MILVNLRLIAVGYCFIKFFVELLVEADAKDTSIRVIIDGETGDIDDFSAD